MMDLVPYLLQLLTARAKVTGVVLSAGEQGRQPPGPVPAALTPRAPRGLRVSVGLRSQSKKGENCNHRPPNVPLPSAPPDTCHPAPDASSELKGGSAVPPQYLPRTYCLLAFTPDSGTARGRMRPGDSTRSGLQQRTSGRRWSGLLRAGAGLTGNRHLQSDLARAACLSALRGQGHHKVTLANKVPAQKSGRGGGRSTQLAVWGKQVKGQGQLWRHVVP